MMVRWTDEDRKRNMASRVNTANEKQLKTLEYQATRLPEHLRKFLLDKIAEKRKEK